ncbi:hypothetical protein WJU16_01990 [Chitinophaga pollutisoli]|uniref:Uncharacterized protein n=1 Tax=Chitinophaga pollutisoli TaxID=3133966 RepID=A0ABZ2YPV0_9BACT
MQHLNWIALSIAGFLLFIGLEYLVSRRTGRNYFHFAESVANLNTGIAERLLDVFVTGLFYFFWIGFAGISPFGRSGRRGTPGFCCFL